MARKYSDMRVVKNGCAHINWRVYVLGDSELDCVGVITNAEFEEIGCSTCGVYVKRQLTLLAGCQAARETAQAAEAQEE